MVDISSNFIELRLIIPPVDRNGVITSYIIKYNRSRGSNGSLEIEPTVYYALSVVPYTTYELSVAANNSACQGNFSDPVVVETLEDGNFLVFSHYYVTPILQILVAHLNLCGWKT